ncbi:MAG: ABC transporter permease [Thermomicrobiales bacterium]|nr:ABC transporter permease [Thermomicrobiales bacterium]
MIGRIGLHIVTLFAVLLTVVTLVFAMLHLAGDPADALVPPGSDPEDVAALREQYGLDESVGRQYLSFISNAIRGDFGTSWRFDQSASRVVLDRLPATLELVGFALLLSIVSATLLGSLAGARPGGVVDTIAHLISLAGQAIPGFWLGTMLILFFSVRLGWAPSSGREGFSSMVLPVLTLAAYPTAVLIRMVRASVEDAYRNDYVRTARGKGLSESAVLALHVARNAAIAPIAFAGVLAGFLLAGAVVVEWVFAYPGAGQLALQSVSNRDLPVVLMFVTCSAVFIVLANLAAEIATLLADPRLRDAEPERMRSW